MKSILIFTDGYDINTQVFKDHDDAYEKMALEYNNYKPEENSEDFENYCYLNENDAKLFSNGENVYLWKIIDV